MEYDTSSGQPIVNNEGSLDLTVSTLATRMGGA